MAFFIWRECAENELVKTAKIRVFYVNEYNVSVLIRYTLYAFVYQHVLMVIVNGYLWHNLLLCCFKIICLVIKFCNQKSFRRVGHVGIPFWVCFRRRRNIKLTGWTAGDVGKGRGWRRFSRINLGNIIELVPVKSFQYTKKHAADEYLVGWNNNTFSRVGSFRSMGIFYLRCVFTHLWFYRDIRNVLKCRICRLHRLWFVKRKYIKYLMPFPQRYFFFFFNKGIALLPLICCYKYELKFNIETATTYCTFCYYTLNMYIHRESNIILKNHWRKKICPNLNNIVAEYLRLKCCHEKHKV